MIRETMMIGMCGVAMAAVGQAYEISRATIDGGGVMRSTGDAFELSGTIGQPDAGVLRSAGGEFELTGGFWFGLDPGDCNEDGGVSLFDHTDFAACAGGPAGGVVIEACGCFDVNRNGTVDLADFAIVQATHTGG